MEQKPLFKSRHLLFFISCFPIFLIMAITYDPAYFVICLIAFFTGWTIFSKSSMEIRERLKNRIIESHNRGNIRSDMALLRLTEAFLASPIAVIIILFQKRDFLLSMFHR